MKRCLGRLLLVGSPSLGDHVANIRGRGWKLLGRSLIALGYSKPHLICGTWAPHLSLLELTRPPLRPQYIALAGILRQLRELK